MARYFIHLPPDGSPAIFWRTLSRVAGELIHINLNLLAHAVGTTRQPSLRRQRYEIVCAGPSGTIS